MKLASWLAAGLFGALNLVRAVYAVDLFEAHALSPCSDDSIVSINRFDIVFTPSNNSVVLGFTGSFSESTSQNVMVELELLVYGYKAINKTFDPCTSPHISFLCPMQSASLNLKQTTLTLPGDVLSDIPGRFFGISSCCPCPGVLLTCWRF